MIVIIDSIGNYGNGSVFVKISCCLSRYIQDFSHPFQQGGLNGLFLFQ